MAEYEVLTPITPKETLILTTTSQMRIPLLETESIAKSF